jgi:hypothetical protein
MKYEEITLFDGTTLLAGASSAAFNLTHYLGYSVQFMADDTTPVAGAFTAAVTDICTKAAHGYKTGLQVSVSSDGTLPSGLAALPTVYYVIKGTDNTFALSDSYAHAIAGTDIVNIGDSGTGTHTITPTAIGTCSVKLECSNNGTVWDDVASGSFNITADIDKVLNFSAIYYKYVRATFAIATGQVAITGLLLAKGE